MRRTRVLFIAEPATLAHVVRCGVLARGLDASEFDVAMASDSAYRRLLALGDVPWLPLHAIGARTFLDRVARGQRIYSESDLVAYAEDDRRLFDLVEPDVVIGDFRLSLAVSARRARIPYLALCNAYWDRRAEIAPDVPVHAATRVFGVTLTRLAFSATRPAFLAYHGAPVSALKRRFGVAATTNDIRDAVVDADMRLFADAPDLVPIRGRTRNDVYLGPIAWAPDVPLPIEATRDSERPLAYVTLGSSGDPRSLPAVVDALRVLGCRVVVSTAGTTELPACANVEVVPFANGAALARRSALVVSNGGSATWYQALAEGTPVLAIPSNMDQLFATAHFARAGVGLALRADQVSRARVERLARTLLTDASFRARAGAAARTLAGSDPAAELARVLRAFSSPRATPDGRPVHDRHSLRPTENAL